MVYDGEVFYAVALLFMTSWHYCSGYTLTHAHGMKEMCCSMLAEAAV
jgi:hypothetical protein